MRLTTFKRFHFRKKKVFHTPWEKLIDTLALILAGGTAMSQLETLIRPDSAVQQAFGRWHSASSSQIQDTLDACTPETVSGLQQANGCARKKFITETLELGARVASMKLVIINQWVQFPPDQSPSAGR